MNFVIFLEIRSRIIQSRMALWCRVMDNNQEDILSVQSVRTSKLIIKKPNQIKNGTYLNLITVEKRVKKDAKRCYGYLLCPELLLWIAEAAGIDITEAVKEAKIIIDSGEAYSNP